MMRHRRLRPVAIVVALAILIQGCHQWKQEPLSARSLNERQLSSARVRMADGRQLRILQPRVVGDSLTGHFDSLSPGPASQPRSIVSVPVAVAMGEVRSVESGHVNGWKTAGVVFAVLAVASVSVLSTMRLCFCER